MKNKFGVRITKAERKYFNSLKQSIRRSSKNIEDVLQPLKTESYLRRKTNNFVPVLKKTTVHSFKTREDFLREVESLTKLKTDLAIYKPRKPKNIEDLPKRLQRDAEKEERRYSRTRRVRPPLSMKREARLLNTIWLNKRNETYRNNMVTAIYKTFEEEIARELINAIQSMSEVEFLKFFLSRPNETIGFVYYNPHAPNTKQLDLMRSIANATTS